MNGHEFIRRVSKVGKSKGVAVRFEARRGKGNHGRLYYGGKFTTVKDRRKEISPGLLAEMLRQLELPKDELLA